MKPTWGNLGRAIAYDLAGHAADEGLQMARRGVRAGVKRVGNWAVSKFQTPSKRPRYRPNRGGKSMGTLSSVISTQHDQSLRYRKTRMPRRRRNRWKRFTRRVKHVMLQMQQLVSYTKRYTSPLKSWLVNEQMTDGQMLGGTTVTDNDELFQIFRNYYGSGFTTSTVDDLKLFVKSACLDMQITNTGVAGCVVDVYFLKARKSYATATRLDQQYLLTYAEMPSGVAGSLVGTPAPADPATTPFQNSMFCEFWRIIAKKEVILATGQTTTLQIRLPTNKRIQGKVLENSLSMIPGYSMGILMQARGVPVAGAVTPFDTLLAAGSINWSSQVTVCYAQPPGTTRTTTAQT